MFAIFKIPRYISLAMDGSYTLIEHGLHYIGSTCIVLSLSMVLIELDRAMDRKIGGASLTLVCLCHRLYLSRCSQHGCAVSLLTATRVEDIIT